MPGVRLPAAAPPAEDDDDASLLGVEADKEEEDAPPPAAVAGAVATPAAAAPAAAVAPAEGEMIASGARPWLRRLDTSCDCHNAFERTIAASASASTPTPFPPSISPVAVDVAPAGLFARGLR